MDDQRKLRKHQQIPNRPRRQNTKAEVNRKQWRREVAEFGECIYYCKLKSKGPSGRIKNTWDERWHEGIWLGVREDSGEIFVGTEEGVVRANPFRRKAGEENR